MNQEQIEKLLIDVVCELQDMSGREAVTVTSESRPLLDMPGFDSLNGVEATVDALTKLGLDLDVINVFANNERALTIREASAQLLSCMPK